MSGFYSESGLAWTNSTLFKNLGVRPAGDFAITGHEAAHAYAARHFGDNTAYLEGRMTLNPLRHIDWIGLVLLPLVCVAVGGFIFGWAKPVPVRFGNLRHPKRDMLWVSAAGPGPIC